VGISIVRAMFARLTLCTFLALSLPLAATAAPVVYYGPGMDGADAAISAKELLGTGDVHVRGSLADLTGPAGAPVVVGAVQRGCSGKGEALERVLIGARLQVDELEYDSALGALTGAVNRLPCGAESATREHLFELFFLQGYIHFNEGDKVDAQAAFAQAAAIDRTRDWPSGFPPTAKTTYLEGLKMAVGGDQAPLRAQVQTLSVDGIPADLAAPPSLVEGDHLVVADGQALWVTVGPRASRPAGGLLVTTGGRLANGIASGNSDYAPWLSAACARLKADSLLIVTTSSSWLFTGGQFTTPQSAVVEPAGPPPGVYAGAVLLASGGGLLGAGLGLHLQAFKEAEPDENGGVPIAAADYPGVLARNRAGFGLAAAGGALLGTGIVVMLVSKLSGSPVAAAPWVAPSNTGVGFGVSGRF
jgi:hypothetical protein